MCFRDEPGAIALRVEHLQTLEVGTCSGARLCRPPKKRISLNPMSLHLAQGHMLGASLTLTNKLQVHAYPEFGFLALHATAQAHVQAITILPYMQSGNFPVKSSHVSCA